MADGSFRPLGKPRRRRLDRDRFDGLPQSKDMPVRDREAIARARKPYCVHCRIAYPRWTLEVHHIRFRSLGGGDTGDNLICLCAGPGTRDCHGRAQRHEISADHLRTLLVAELAAQRIG